MEQQIKKIVLAYSGGLDTSVIIKWLKEQYDTEIIAFSADIGQGQPRIGGNLLRGFRVATFDCFLDEFELFGMASGACRAPGFACLRRKDAVAIGAL